MVKELFLKEYILKALKEAYEKGVYCGENGGYIEDFEQFLTDIPQFLTLHTADCYIPKTRYDTHEEVIEYFLETGKCEPDSKYSIESQDDQYYQILLVL